MIKTRLLVGVAALMCIGAITPAHNAISTSAERDSRIIIELSKGVNGLTQEEISNTQSALLSRIRQNVTNNIELLHSYSILNNAICVEVNSEDIEAIREVPGVASVTVDNFHLKESTGETYSVNLQGRVDENISATTMQKPGGTNEGEGTAIAILDNEFFLRGNHTEDENCAFHKYGCDGSAIHHEVYTDLPDYVNVRFGFEDIKSITSTKRTHAQAKRNAAAGDEGSLYFNRKVPFYYDYGGETSSYGKQGKTDYDVSSSLSYHGSHVASIASANAPTYKGIAPNAQLFCMKVFTNYKATKTGENLGFGDSSGAYESCILLALEDAIALGVDGINMSLGSDLDDFDSDSITLRTLTRLANEEGILTAISAGNSGKTSFSSVGGYANWTKNMVETGILGSYANNESIMTIASGQPDQIYYEKAFRIGESNIAFEDQIVNREGLDAEFLVEYPMIEKLREIGPGPYAYQYVPGFGTSSDYTGLDVDGKIAFVNRGSTSFADKYKVAKDKGAIALVIINNDPTASDFNFRCSFGDGFLPSMPCALILYKDKTTMEANPTGTFTFIEKDVSDNKYKRTISSFSSDGFRYDLDLKPEITAPGENIRGAVPPQTKEERETPLTSYQYLSGTSMSSPNFAGAQSLVLSKRARDVYNGDEPTAAELAELKEFRKTVNMRLMSTAVPMNDANPNPETKEINYTSPRMQGAGMVNLEGAYDTEVYLEGKDELNKGIGKSKIVLRNNSDIANGNLKLSFLAHNESQNTKNYNVKLTVMRPAIIEANDIITKDYNYRGEIESIKLLPGVHYYDGDTLTWSSGSVSYKDVFKLTKQIDYVDENGNPASFAQGTYYCATEAAKNWSGRAVEWKILPSHEYQSTQDVVIAEVSGQTVSVPTGTSTVTINEFKIPESAKDDILKNYENGCAIEGFVELESEDNTPDLVIPYLGFYSGSDRDSSKSYASAPVVEEFEFEKDQSQVYASDLVNDITKQLIGKDNVEFGSMWLTGYVDNPSNINTETVLSNDSNFKKLGFKSVGLNPSNEKYLDDVKNNIYVGNPNETNTMIIQQFVLRSVADNYFTIKNENGDIVYKSVLEDMLFGQQRGKYPLYKSHVDANYLSAGYVAHRAYAAIPLYDTKTNEAFEDGKYEIEFNYLLQGTGTWTSLKYGFYVDSTAPIISKVVEEGDNVAIEIKEMRASYAAIGYSKYDVDYNAQKGCYEIILSKEEVKSLMEEVGASKAGVERLYIKVFDMARGYTGALVHFNGDNFSKYEMVQGRGINVYNDFTYKDGKISFIEIDEDGNEMPTKIEGNVKYSTETTEVMDLLPNVEVASTNNNLIIAIVVSVSVLSMGCIAYIAFALNKKKRKADSASK